MHPIFFVNKAFMPYIFNYYIFVVTLLMRFTFLLLVLLISVHCLSQEDSTKSIKVTTYVDMYYSYDFSNPNNFEKPDFNYNYKKHNQLNVNLAFVKLGYQSSRMRSNLALMTGNYAMYNLSAEPNWAKPLLEANIGYKPFKQHHIWVDAGVMPSHLGFESAVGSDCWNLSRSILAENSPYYETGIKLSYTNKKEDLYFAFHVLNGWQKIAVTNKDQAPSMGLQLTYKPSNTLTLNYSNFIGRIHLDSLNALRIFHNLYAIYEASPKTSLIFGFDIGTQKNTQSKVAVWYTPVLIAKLNLNSKSKIAGRIEYYMDKNQVIIPTATPNGFQTFGVSVNYDRQILPYLLMRTELKQYNSKDRIYRYEQTTASQTTATMAFIVKF